MSAAIVETPPVTETAWSALRYFNLYRLIVSGLFVVLIWAQQLPPPLGIYDRRLFAIGAIGYFALAVAGQVIVEYRVQSYSAQVFGQVLLDIVAITLMMYASGGVSSGFGMLLVVAIAGGSILTAGRTAILFAAIASMAVLGEEFYSWLHFYFPAVNYTHAGLLGATFFATAFVGHVLARRIRESEALAAQRTADLANLAMLNEHIVQRMQSGIVVLDEADRVRLANESARRLLGLQGRVEGRVVADIASELSAQLEAWRHDRESPTRLVQPSSGEVDVLASFTGLAPTPDAGVLIFLEDASKVRQRAQELKLASLGRLTASIAHEVRNPLGAISHAGQLLSESPSLSGEDSHLTGIIKEQCTRVNAIIENVMRISRRSSAVPESFAIKPWLRRFVAEFAAQHGLEQDALALSLPAQDVMVRMDPGQLHQVLWNLAENGLRYTRGKPMLEFICDVREESQRPFLDVVDHGPGMASEVADQIFEPFYTTDPQGTGLGLYISRELCESNQAALSLHANSTRGCIFRIIFAHPDRQQAIVP